MYETESLYGASRLTLPRATYGRCVGYCKVSHVFVGLLCKLLLPATASNNVYNGKVTKENRKSLEKLESAEWYIRRIPSHHSSESR